MKRQEFFSHSRAGVAGVSPLPSILLGCRSTLDPLHQFGWITNAVQNRMEEHHRATMTLLSEMGYKYKEVAGFKHLIVEHDKPQPGNELKCARSSINYLKSLKF